MTVGLWFLCGLIASIIYGILEFFSQRRITLIGIGFGLLGPLALVSIGILLLVIIIYLLSTITLYNKD